MDRGSVVMFHGTSLISRLIRYFTKSSYSHAGLAVGDGYMIEADRFIRVRVRKIDEKDGTFDVYSLPKATEYQKDLIVATAMGYIDLEYDYWLVLELFFKSLLRLNFTIYNDARKLICFELVDRAYFASGAWRKGVAPLGDVTANELIEAYSLRKESNLTAEMAVKMC